MKKLLFIAVLFVSVNSFSQKLTPNYLADESYQPLKRLSANSHKTLKREFDSYDYVLRKRRIERVIGGTIFGTALVFFVKGLINTYRIAY
jgi:hypothetical protein